MVMIKIWNTLTQKKETFSPINPSDVRMYVCGPTVYDRAHIGNARPAVVFDLMYRLLREVYGSENVTYVRNITDIDDKINQRALEQKGSGDKRMLLEIVRSITNETIQWYHEDMDLIGVKKPTHEPRATEFVPQMIAMISTLISTGNAYESSGHVLFDVNSFEHYGDLAKRSLDDMRAGARVEIAPYKKNDLDFVLWKPSTDEMPGWDSPWGRGRPGWHIECSAMSSELLGKDFDLHGGGTDLCFPHHENEIAQSKSVNKNSIFAKYWMHNGMIRVNGQKMSKSLNNFFTIQDLIKKGISGAEIRLVLLSTHYRQKLDWTEEKIREAKKNLRDWAKLLTDKEVEGIIENRVLDAIKDDLNTPAALAEIHRLANSNQIEKLKGSLDFLGFEYPFSEGMRSNDHQFRSSDKKWIEGLLQLRSFHRGQKNFSKADRIRTLLEECGVMIADKAGSLVSDWKLDDSGFDSNKLRQLAKDNDLHCKPSNAKKEEQ